MFHQPVGILFAAFGEFLAEEWGGSDYDSEKRLELKERLKAEFNKHGHSGGSALVEVQQLFDMLGARCLDDNTRAYLMDLQDALPAKEAIKK